MRWEMPSPRNRNDRKNMIKRVLVYPNQKRDLDYRCTRRVIAFLAGRQVEVFAPPETARQLSDERISPISEEDKQSMDLALVLGGDGSMIQGAQYLLGRPVPILGINLGTLGYLTEVEPSHLEESLEQVLSGRYQVEKRLILEAEVETETSEKPLRLWAVNDFVLHRNLTDGILPIRTYVNDRLLSEFRADGVIVASPCGSTAYNFSAGGPIVNPVADNLILTPLCSHSMLDRSIVLMGSDELSFQVGATEKGKQAMLSADGGSVVPLAEGTWVRVKKSEYTFPLIQLLQRSFYEVLQKKMKP